MVTADEVARITIFAGLDADEQGRLARASADITLAVGEYAAHQGSEQALFGLLEGRIEAVQVVDGIERTVGERAPGEVFGEVPITFGTVFPVGFRAAEASRVMRLDPRDYHAVAAVAPEVAAEVGRLAVNRIQGARGLSGLAVDRPPRRAVVLGAQWDASCADVRRFLDRNHISYDWITPAAEDAVGQWGEPLPSDDELPSVRILEAGIIVRPHLRQVAGMLELDDRDVVRPQLRRIAELLELPTEAEATEYDVVVVGGGPAGLAAAVYGASEGLRTLVIEREAPGGQAGTSSKIENYLGFPDGVSGDELAGRALRQAGRLGAEILVTRSITHIDAETRRLNLDAGDVLQARTIILACGVTWRRRAARADDHHRLRGVMAPALARGRRPAHGQGHLLRPGAERGAEHARHGRAHRRRRQLGGPGGDELRQPRQERHGALPRRRSRAEHVPLPDRPPRQEVEHRGAHEHRGRRRARRHVDRGDRHSRLRDRRDVAARD